MTQPGLTSHLCHATGCPIPVPPAKFMCRSHWFRLSKFHRDAIWRNYVRGQEVTKTPTQAYLRAAVAAVEYLDQQERESGPNDDQ